VVHLFYEKCEQGRKVRYPEYPVIPQDGGVYPLYASTTAAENKLLDSADAISQE
jgi:hypothetical protein